MSGDLSGLSWMLHSETVGGAKSHRRPFSTHCCFKALKCPSKSLLISVIYMLYFTLIWSCLRWGFFFCNGSLSLDLSCPVLWCSLFHRNTAKKITAPYFECSESIKKALLDWTADFLQFICIKKTNKHTHTHTHTLMIADLWSAHVRFQEAV